MTDPASEIVKAHPSEAMFMTLTLPPKWHARVSESSRVAANKLLGSLLRKWTRWQQVRLRRAGADPMRYFWIREDHRSGVPHVHMLAFHPYLARELRDRDHGWDALRATGMIDAAEWEAITQRSDHTLAPEHWRERAIAYGWGERFDAQLARSREAIASYCAKTITLLNDREIDGAMAGEMTKARQSPELLPRNCRSYGYSPGLIPPRHKDPAWTGWLEGEHGPHARPAPAPIYTGMGTPIRDHEQWRDLLEHTVAGRASRGGPVFDPHDLTAWWPNAAAARRHASSFFGGRVERRIRLDVRAEQFGQCVQHLPAAPGGAEPGSYVIDQLLRQNIHVALDRRSMTCEHQNGERDQIGRDVFDYRDVKPVTGEVADRVTHEVCVLIHEGHEPVNSARPRTRLLHISLQAAHELNQA